MIARWHWSDRGSPACGQSGYALLVTDDRLRVTCKRCLRLQIMERAIELGLKWAPINEHGEMGWVRR